MIGAHSFAELINEMNGGRRTGQPTHQHREITDTMRELGFQAPAGATFYDFTVNVNGRTPKSYILVEGEIMRFHVAKTGKPDAHHGNHCIFSGSDFNETVEMLGKLATQADAYYYDDDNKFSFDRITIRAQQLASECRGFSLGI